jgi:hypothetical protein
MICVECGHAVVDVYKEFSVGNIRLTRCVGAVDGGGDGAAGWGLNMGRNRHIEDECGEDDSERAGAVNVDARTRLMMLVASADFAHEVSSCLIGELLQIR